ncbi:MAG: CBS domain-containing protein [Hyphomicrobiales bacterium]|uniref:CBS domain-containing protein n=1 Tax=Aestuariivirga sp. TaxID=2650926 RepID=UPI0035B08D10
MTVARIIKNKVGRVITAAPGDSILAVAARLTRHHIGALVVLDKAGAIVGMIRENDVVRAVASGQACTIGVTAQDIMNSCKHTCSPDTPEAELLEMMSEHHVQHLPVLSEGRLAGIVSLGDVVRLRREKIREMLSELEQLADHGRFTANLKRPRAGHPHLSMARAG